MSSFFVKITVLATFLISIETFYLPCFKRKLEKFCEKKNLGFVDADFVKTCREHVTTVLNIELEYNLYEYAFDFLFLQSINFHQHHGQIITKGM